MATRAQAREAVAGLLYAYDTGNREIRKFAVDILEEKRIKNRQQEFALGLFDGVIAHLEAIDEEIVKHLKEWDFTRIGDMERAILRLGAYEIIYSGVDRAVVINEAVELSKTFGNDNSPRFVNGVLDALRPDLKKES